MPQLLCPQQWPTDGITHWYARGIPIAHVLLSLTLTAHYISFSRSKMAAIIQCVFVAAFLACIWAENKTCPDGMFLHPLKYVCSSCTICPKGSYATRSCENFDDARCRPCPNGTFSGRSSYRRNVCTNCTSCTNYKTKCTKTIDAVCSKEEILATSKVIYIILTVAVVFSLIVSILCIVCWCRKRVRRPPSRCNELESMRPQDQD